MNKKLKPCPLCGGNVLLSVIPPHTHETAVYMPDYPGRAFIECVACELCISDTTVEEVLLKWNKRWKGGKTG